MSEFEKEYAIWLGVRILVVVAIVVLASCAVGMALG